MPSHFLTFFLWDELSFASRVQYRRPVSCRSVSYRRTCNRSTSCAHPFRLFFLSSFLLVFFSALTFIPASFALRSFFPSGSLGWTRCRTWCATCTRPTRCTPLGCSSSPAWVRGTNHTLFRIHLQNPCPVINLICTNHPPLRLLGGQSTDRIPPVEKL